VEQGPGGQLEGPGRVMLPALTRRHHRHSGPLGPPGTAAGGPPRAIAFLRPGPDRGARERLAHPAPPGPPGAAVGGLSWGEQLGTLPHPTALVHPAAQRRGRGGAAARGRHSQGPGGATPAPAAPAVGPRGGLAQGDERAPQGGERHGRAHRRPEPPRAIVFPAEGALLLGTPGTGDAGARAVEDRGDVPRGAPRCPPQQEVEGSPIAVPRPPECGQHPGWSLLRTVDHGALGHSGVAAVQGYVPPSPVVERNLAGPMSWGSI
jgi:hypothetical protein